MQVLAHAMLERCASVLQAMGHAWCETLFGFGN
jgi:hypothetical protein